MQLEHTQRLVYEECFACVHAGEAAVVYPIEFLGRSNLDHKYYFDIYYKTNFDPRAEYHGSRQKSVVFCEAHTRALYHEYELYVIQEVQLSDAYFNWLDRIENEREDSYLG